jgi:HEAT repeat protein
MRQRVIMMRRRFEFFVLILAAASSRGPLAAQPPSNERGVHLPDETRNEREKLRYAGRGFDDWRDQLLNDLDSKTCTQAMAALATFAKKGYEEEAIAALTRMVHDDRLDVAMDTAQTLGQIGGKAVAALIDGLSDERPQVRMRAAQSLGRLGKNARPATKALVNLLNDRQDMVRAAVTQTLVIAAADDESLHSLFQRLAASDDVLVRRAFVEGLKVNSAQDVVLLRLLVQAVDDDDAVVRSTAGVVLAESAPPDRPVIDALKKLLADNDPRKVWQNTLNALGNPGNPATKVAVLVEIVTSPEDFANLRQQGRLTVAIHLLGGARDQADVAVPALAALIERKVAGLDDPASVSVAIDALGRIGPAAKRAVPALERWIFDEPQVALGNGETLEKHARLALRKIIGPNAEAHNAAARPAE